MWSSHRASAAANHFICAPRPSHNDRHGCYAFCMHIQNETREGMRAFKFCTCVFPAVLVRCPMHEPPTKTTPKNTHRHTHIHANLMASRHFPVTYV